MGEFLLWFAGIPFGLFLIFIITLFILDKLRKKNKRLNEVLHKLSNWIDEVSPNEKQQEVLVMIVVIAVLWIYMKY